MAELVCEIMLKITLELVIERARHNPRVFIRLIRGLRNVLAVVRS